MEKDTSSEKFKWFYKKYISPKKYWIVFVVTLIFIGATIGNLSPLLYGKMLDSITASNLDLLFKLIVIYFFITMGTTIFSLIEGFIGQMLSFRLVKKSQKDLFERIVTLSQSAYDKYKSGELISRLNGDSDSVVSFYLNVITSIMQIIINMGISIYFVLTISTKLSSVAIFYIPASFLITFMSRKYYKLLALERKKLGDQYYSYLNESFSNNVGIKSFKLEKMIFSKFDGFISRELKILKKSFVLGGIMQILTTFVTVVSSLYIIYLSAILIKSDLLTIGTMVSFNTYINKLFSSISQVLGLNISKQEVSVSMDRLWTLFSEKSEQDDEKNNSPISDAIDLEIEQAGFSYSEDNDAVISNLNFKLDTPGFYSFVGQNGCGKSTLAKLLIKLYDLNKGKIEINGRDYNHCSAYSIRDTVTYIQKEEFFLNESVYFNLLLANEKASKEEIHSVCNSVGIGEFIETLPDKYDTVIGESGSTLSSGQKQKLNVARALLRDTSIMIFDEITANLDGKAEKEIIVLLKEISKKSIVIFISHKASSIMQSDRIFLMDNGNIIDSGTHGELIKSNSIYQDLFKNLESN